jgi:hypothetical protein
MPSFPDVTQRFFPHSRAVVHQFQNPWIMGPARAFGKKMSVILMHGLSIVREPMDGLLRRFAPRNDEEKLSLRAGGEAIHLRP